MKKPLRNLSLQELEELSVQLGDKPFRGRQLAGWLFKKSASRLEEMSDLGKEFLAKLDQEYTANSLELVSRNVSAADKSVKYLFRTQDGQYLETVLILSKKRRTVCLSTQVGCGMGCRFCASGKEGFVRHLSAGEILDQIAWVAKDRAAQPTNLVYMGMGEPLDNYDATVRSIRAANARWGFEIGQRHITVSTVGIVPGIKKLAKEDLGQIKISFSLHSPDDAVRTKIIPTNRKNKLEEIVETLKAVRPTFKRDMTMEYILIAGLTDRDEDAARLIDTAKSLRAKVNLIPYNKIEGETFERPSPARIAMFQKKLDLAGVRTTVRYSAGQDIDAACGQLRLKEERKRRAAKS